MCLLSAVGTSWIVDCGATDHMCHDLKIFWSYSFIKDNDRKITLPDGKQVSVLFSGNICLSNNIVLEDMLYVPDFKFNLISILKICHDMKCNMVQ